MILISHIINLLFFEPFPVFLQSQCPHCSFINTGKSFKNSCVYDMCLMGSLT